MFSCYACGDEFKSKSGVNQHIRRYCKQVQSLEAAGSSKPLYIDPSDLPGKTSKFSYFSRGKPLELRDEVDGGPTLRVVSFVHALHVSDSS